MGRKGGHHESFHAGRELTSASEVGLRARIWRFWSQHRALLWALHSVWALATGVVVLVLARERYDFVVWVVVFMALTWVSTLFFGRHTTEAAPVEGGAAPPTVGQEVTSYLTRIMYQETLFFLLPFYAYSTVFRSENVAFLLLLGGLAILACLDLVFDRLLRSSPVFGLVFFALVAFAGLNLLLPILFGLRPAWATPVSAALAVGAALPLALREGHTGLWRRIRLGGAALLFLGVAIGAPGLVPPVPLRMTESTFARDLTPATLQLRDSLTSFPVPASEVGASMVVLVRVFAPTTVPTRVQLEWRRDGQSIRSTRPVDIVAHEGAFRVWDRISAPGGSLPPGTYRVVLRTVNGRVFGVADAELRP